MTEKSLQREKCVGNEEEFCVHILTNDHLAAL